MVFLGCSLILRWFKPYCQAAKKSIKKTVFRVSHDSKTREITDAETNKKYVIKAVFYPTKAIKNAKKSFSIAKKSLSSGNKGATLLWLSATLLWPSATLLWPKCDLTVTGKRENAS